ncbi:bifunctional transcriptional activator/DNA repair enzyme AdaA [Pseudobacter ginsenosidimutans]|uniref:methylated-DNA--[protein]-cysteine S-methyltransferase n=1 Tax=Pseudobacter ginsenosidimutans TaxID=661488 RepID=A0A4Q7N2F6_9BACT|nr:methylated-DNA--[protein]-cysteine S-methyltransferase [Pseudobacter ginsenosidimutans]QEC43600.1 methylated-DNA--[protein]-cysteine S-methyltransferase [Pseudobacter ginsenosidimutans]RZS74999.1 AraC family transcriptional regulator of adaptative response/methylated-DNA-[protein]-cysteine methyltransferase [Pseudobacter ginsenosidimutans]
MLTNERMYQAIIDKDPSFEGQFITAVKTTGIFCRPTCTARKPKPENVEFLPSTAEAMRRGYRPCKVCHPLESAGEAPEQIRVLMKKIQDDPTTKLKDWDLVQLGLEPSQVRRWFLKNHGITFHAYQRMFRLNTAFTKIRNGESVTAAAFDAGYESLSAFGDSFRNVYGVSPSNSRQKGLINITRLETPLGSMFACATGEGICLLEFTDRKMLETELKWLSKHLNASIVQGANKHFDQLQRELQEYFDGKRKDFTVPLFMPGTVFQQEVWKMLITIPYGTTRSYKMQAMKLQRPEAIRAVANANGMNRVSILVPCHRVIGEDGKLTGYGGGLHRKQWLLDHEKACR